jgi:hypothetical protein
MFADFGDDLEAVRIGQPKGEDNEVPFSDTIAASAPVAHRSQPLRLGLFSGERP